ncbi:glycine cleavage system protein GcvH [Pelagibaculum spongiae]|uniref:Glycine cleavage system H protein n=1 Tax=Pelagibaculum spongiae TaxID=2080658 RepID=A0A2V1GN86_9GAMM|nr:glycine cleavage system protein GcvH [Pelagibaculum spongiae]
MPSELKFASSHEWVKDNGDGTVTVGISEHAQELLGDVVFVELPEVGSETTAGEGFALVESVKAASDVYAPVSGEVVEANEALDDEPELVNTDSFGGAWIAKIKLSDASELDNLMNAEVYAESIAE